MTRTYLSPINHSMKRILNFLGIGRGGGLQNSMSFLDTLAVKPEAKSQCVALVRRGHPLHEACRRCDIDHLTFSAAPATRPLLGVACRKHFDRGQTCFTIFGPVLLGTSGYFFNVNGCAYSNLFYPEIPFWHSGRSWLSLQLKQGIDILRQHWTTRADYWIFETEALRRRAIELCGFPESRVAVVRMAASNLVSPEKVDDEQSQVLERRLPEGFRFLFLAGAHPNKRIDRLPAIASELRKRGETNFVFVTTMPERDPYANAVVAAFRERGLDQHLHNVGPVPPADVSTLIHCVDAMCTFSRLESFSNNFVEAWRMRRPLVVTDGDWSRDSCGDAAFYLDPANAVESAEGMARLMNRSDLRERLVAQGDTQLAMYPTAAEKLDRYFQCLEEAEILGPCTPRERARIHWPKSRTTQL